MKHLFHMMIATVLLLGSLILFNAQESEAAKLAVEAPAMELTDLQAELSTSHTAVSTVLCYWFYPAKENKYLSGKLDPLTDQILTGNQVRRKKQIQIHLELKPLIARQTGQNIQNRSRCDDPPVS